MPDDALPSKGVRTSSDVGSSGSGWTVFLDRDGVFNVHPRFGIRRWADFHWLPGVWEAFARLARPDIRTCLCTNQPWVGMGLARARTVQDIHRRMQKVLEAAGGRLDRIEVSYAPGWLPHRRRKPRPGMLEDGAAAFAAEGWNVDPARSFMVGDKLKDAQAGLAFGARAILLGTTTPVDRLQARARDAGVDAVIVSDLPEAVDWILATIGQEAHADRRTG